MTNKEGRIRGKNLIGKTVVSEEKGRRFGEVEDMSFVSNTGELMNVLVTDTTQHIDELNLEKDNKGRFMVPFSAVKSVGDFVIVSADDIV
ncbi:MAG: PRC-barrel domain-containing protein [Candidatus Nanohaloarchaeota archaeon QJJ-9]|nr:PRC-barrel domain-containing protein [Candidatus Nanohaloarchaeota archaeon QJJ-9]